jgi:heat shock protein HslJ
MRKPVKRRRTALFGLLVGIVAGCAAGASPLSASDPAQKEDGLTGGTWVAQDIRGEGVVDTAQSSIKFTEGGRISGSGACNRFMGAAKQEGEQLSFSEIAGTRMACPPALMDQENKFLAALEETRSFRIDGTFLTLLDQNGTAIVRLTRQP